tara:strand:- start:221 stop:481 length:261 start_codon:yes stop_codon:yes gene_type:complete
MVLVHFNNLVIINNLNQCLMMTRNCILGEGRLVQKGPQPMPDLPDDIAVTNDNDLYKFFSQHTEALTSLWQATIYENDFVDCQHLL